jgi:hypothetical protein
MYEIHVLLELFGQFCFAKFYSIFVLLTLFTEQRNEHKMQ